MSVTRSSARLFGMLVVASIAIFLLGRLSNRSYPASQVSATPASMREGWQSESLSVKEASKEKNTPQFATPLKTASQVPSHWKIAFERIGQKSPNYTRERPDIWIANSDGTNPHRILTDAEAPSWSPDRKRLAFVRHGNIWLANADGSQTHQLSFWPEEKNPNGYYPYISGISWNQKDNLISFARGEKFQLIREYSAAPDHTYGVTLHHVSLEPKTPRDKRFPYAVSPYQTRTNYEDGTTKYPRSAPRFDLTEGHSGFAFSKNAFPAWSADGDKLLFARNGDIFLAERETDDYTPGRNNWLIGRVIANAEYDGHTIGGSRWSVETTGLSWAPDESFFVYTYHRMYGSGIAGATLVRKTITTDEEGRESVGWKEDESVSYPYVYSACVSPDGCWVLFNGKDNETVAVSVDGKQQKTVLKDADNAVW